MPESLFIKKETLAQVFSCEFSEISKNTFFHRTPLVAASGDVKVVPPFHIFLQIFYKNVKVLALSYNFSHFVPIFKKIDEKPVQI